MKIIKSHISIFHAVTFLLLLFPLLGGAQVVSKELKDLFTVGDESVNFQSAINNSEYKLYVNLPESYANDATKAYPVFYALDGSRTFDATTRVYKGLWDDGFVPEMIIVGITYSGTKENPLLNRSRDLTPTAIERINSSGGASTFLKVLGEELIPMIDRLYRTDKTNRTLAGTSFAALFTHFTLFTQPSLFNKYIINNPTFWWDNDYSFKLEEKFYQNNKTLNAHVIFSSGEFDDVPKATKMVEQIKKHNYNHLTLGFRMVENMGHLGGEAEAINQGMRFVYQRPTILLPEEELRAYCGTYEDGNYVREIAIREGELLLLRVGESQGAKIHAISESEFSILGRYLDFHFNKNEEGEVINFSSQLDNDPSRVRIAAKIK